MNQFSAKILIALATAFVTFSANACPPLMNPPSFEEQLAQSYANAHTAFEVKVLVNELIRHAGPAGTDHIKLQVTQAFKGKPSAAVLEIRNRRSGTTCDRPEFGEVGRRAIVFTTAEGRHIWTVTDPEEIVKVLKFFKK